MADLVRLDDDWQEWEFPELTEALKKWTDQNPRIFDPDKNQKLDNLYHSKEKKSPFQNTSLCLSVKLRDRRLKLSWKKLFLYYPGSKHRASECKSRKTCQHCQGKHYATIYEKATNMLLVTNHTFFTYPSSAVEIEC